MTTLLDAHRTVGDMVRERPARSRVFENLKIDYCCGGRLPLAEACAKHQVDVDDVLRQIAVLDAQTDAQHDAAVHADQMSLGELADHIEQTHHAYLRQELPRLDFMTRKVAAVHGDREPRLREIRSVFIAFQDELLSHMMKEERILFPLIRQIEMKQGAAEFHCSSIAHPIAQMEAEHDMAGQALEQFRTLTDDFTPPHWACNTFRAMFDALGELERDMHQHVHKENNVLFPKAIRMEQHNAADFRAS